MSNGAKSILFDQLSRATELVREGSRQPEQLSTLLTAFIRDDAVQITPKARLKEDGLYHVTSNFATLEEAIAAGGYDRLHGLADHPAEIPMGIQPVDEFVDLAPPPFFTEGRDYVTAEEIWNSAFPAMSLLGLLAFGAKFPEVQRDHVPMTVWRDSSGQFWAALLHVDAGRRELVVGRCNPELRFSSHYRLLRSRKFAPSQAA